MLPKLLHSFLRSSSTSTNNTGCEQCHYVPSSSKSSGTTYCPVLPSLAIAIFDLLPSPRVSNIHEIDERDIASQVATSMAKKRCVLIAALSGS